MKTLGLSLLALILSGCLTVNPTQEPSVSGVEDLITVYPANTHVSLHPLTIPVSAISRTSSSEQDYLNSHEITMDKFRSFRPHLTEVTALEVEAHGQGVFSSGQDGKVIFSSLVSSSSGNAVVEIDSSEASIRSETVVSSAKPVLAISPSPDGRKLAVAQYSLVVIIDLKTRQVIQRMTRVAGQIWALAWDPQCSLLAIGRADGDIFVWNLTTGPRAGEDNLEALEEYSAGLSPVRQIVFHPAGRSFFAAEREGRVTLWQLLRTAHQVGTRDDQAVVDKAKIGRERMTVGGFRERFEDLWLDSKGNELFVSTSQGLIHHWRVRGLVYEGSFPVGRDAIFSARGIELSGGTLERGLSKDASLWSRGTIRRSHLSGISTDYQGESDRLKKKKAFFDSPDRGDLSAQYRLLVTSGREQRLKFWCQDLKEHPVELPGTKLVVEVPAEVSAEQLTPIPMQPQAAETEDLLVGQSGVFAHPVSIIRFTARQSLLWAAQKTGNLLVFDAGTLLNSPVWSSRAERCVSAL